MSKKEKKTPTMEQVQEWTKKDLSAAHYFLGMLLQHPEVINSMAKQIYDYAMQKKASGVEQEETVNP